MGSAAVPIALAAASVAASAGGAVYSSNQANAAYNRQQQEMLAATRRAQAVREQERLRQKQWQDDAAKVHDDVLAELTRENQDAAREEYEDDFRGRVIDAIDTGQTHTQAAAALPGNKWASDEIKDLNASKLAEKSAFTRGLIDALARAQGYNGMVYGMGQTLQGGQNQIDLINNMRRGSLATSGIELSAAGTPGPVAPADTTLGDLLQAGGALAGRASGYYAGKM